MEKLVHNFKNDGEAAAEFAFGLVKAHSRSKISKKLCKDYSSFNCNTKNPPPVIVFDIDDTLLVKKTKPNKPIINLFNKIKDDKSLHAHIYIVTARMNTPSYVEETRKELLGVDVYGFRDLIHAPNKYRNNLGDVAVWKQDERIASVLNSKSPYVVLSVGDQWGDILPLKSESEIDTLNKMYGDKNYSLMRTNDGISLWGLKLPANS